MGVTINPSNGLWLQIATLTLTTTPMWSTFTNTTSANSITDEPSGVIMVLPTVVTSTTS